MTLNPREETRVGVVVENKPGIEWRNIRGFEDYLVSNYGDVISLKSGKKRVMKKSINIDGYYVYKLSKDGKQYTKRAGRMVAEHYVSVPSWLSDSRKVVNHMDGDKNNDYYKNLEWTDASGNTHHAYKNGLIDMDNFMSGRKKLMKPLYKIDRNSGKIIKSYNSYQEAIRREGLNRGNFSVALNSGTICEGFIWVYKEDYNENHDYRNPVKKYIAFKKNEGAYVFSNIRKFSMKYGLDPSVVSKCIRRDKYKTHKGWRFKAIN